jgi:hypothetical protein
MDISDSFASLDPDGHEIDATDAAETIARGGDASSAEWRNGDSRMNFVRNNR